MVGLHHLYIFGTCVLDWCWCWTWKAFQLLCSQNQYQSIKFTPRFLFCFISQSVFYAFEKVSSVHDHCAFKGNARCQITRERAHTSVLDRYGYVNKLSKSMPLTVWKKVLSLAHHKQSTVILALRTTEFETRYFIPPQRSVPRASLKKAIKASIIRMGL